jgi:hypothetical protein
MNPVAVERRTSERRSGIRRRIDELIDRWPRNSGLVW